MRSLIERFIRQCLEPREEDTLTGRLRRSIARERLRLLRDLRGESTTEITEITETSPATGFLRNFLAALGRDSSVAVIREIGLRRPPR